MKCTEIFYSASEVWKDIYCHCHDYGVKKISIRTYGLYVGNGRGDINSILKLFKRMEIVNILVGTGDWNSDIYNDHLEKAKELKRWFPRINIRMSPNDHTKCALLGDGTVMIGGVNLTLSTWPDYAFLYHHNDELYKELKSDYILNWNKNKPYEI